MKITIETEPQELSTVANNLASDLKAYLAQKRKEDNDALLKKTMREAVFQSKMENFLPHTKTQELLDELKTRTDIEIKQDGSTVSIAVKD